MRSTIHTLLFAAALATSAVDAGELVYFREGQLLDPARVRALLAAPSIAPVASVAGTGASGARTRAVRLLDPQPAVKADAARPVPPKSDAEKPLAPVALTEDGRVPSVGTIALALRFSFDSSEVHSANRAQLDAVAEGIKQLPEGAVVTIAGHTDAYGHPLYNLDLSLKRAVAVRSYLIAAHGIPRQMIVAVGKGKSEPFNPANPYGAENRRVQIHAEYDIAQLPVPAPAAGGARLLPSS